MSVNFELPIFYNTQKVLLNETIQDDLEMNEMKSDSSLCLYNTLIEPKSTFARKTLPLWKKYYTTDSNFLKDFQKLIGSIKKSEIKCLDCDEMDRIGRNWLDIHGKDGFKEKYQFVEWPYFEPLNNNAQFLQLMSVYNLISPVLSVILPVVLLIVPFFLLKLQGIPVTIGKYIEALKKILVAIPLGQLLRLSEMSWDKRVYALVTCGLYLFQIYQNCLFCYKFHLSLYHMHEYLNNFKNYLTKTEKLMEDFLSNYSSLESFKAFNSGVDLNRKGIQNIKVELEKLTEYKLKPKNIMEIGKAMKLFYKFHCDSYYRDVMNYSFGFNGFIENLFDIHTQVENSFISPCHFSKKNCNMKQAYFAPLKNDTPVKNDITLKKNMIITGPNASGKTTILKTVLFNIILSQQIGYGFYSDANLTLFNHIHSYLNIPDTSCRDSLFQAEARRCKEIIDSLQSSSDNERHFCIFDELYSGTNPSEAVESANAYLNYLNNKKNMKYLLTTHYYDVCTKNKDNTSNFNMKVLTNDNHEFKYTYHLEKGISTIKGGLKVLKDLNYPNEIIEYVKKEI